MSEAATLNILCAYPYLKQTSSLKSCLSYLIEHQAGIRLLLDSGAFTAWKSGKPIELDDYCRYIETLPIKPWRYFMLDVIGEPEKTLRNYELMLNRGFNPVPIFTRGEDPSVLEDYYKTSDVVGIGGLVKTRRNKGFINGIMRHVNKRKCHWLGFTPAEFILHYKPYMCDSSSWAAALQFGQVKLYLGRGKQITISKNDFSSKPKQEVLEAVRAYGEDPAELAKRSEWVNTGKVESTLERMAYKSALWKNKELEARTGTKIFLACTERNQIRGFHLAMEFLRSAKPSLFIA